MIMQWGTRAGFTAVVKGCVRCRDGLAGISGEQLSASYGGQKETIQQLPRHHSPIHPLRHRLRNSYRHGSHHQFSNVFIRVIIGDVVEVPFAKERIYNTQHPSPHLIPPSPMPGTARSRCPAPPPPVWLPPFYPIYPSLPTYRRNVSFYAPLQSQSFVFRARKVIQPLWWCVPRDRQSLWSKHWPERVITVALSQLIFDHTP